MTERELLDKIEQLEARVAELEARARRTGRCCSPWYVYLSTTNGEPQTIRWHYSASGDTAHCSLDDIQFTPTN